MFFFILLLLGPLGCDALEELESGMGQDPMATVQQALSEEDSASLQLADSALLPGKRPFCKGRAPGECFTLVLRLPADHLIADLGLATLNLTRHPRARPLRELLLRTCDDGLNSYIRQYQGQQRLLRGRYFNQVKDSRCLVQFLENEAEEEPMISPGQKALSIRLLSTQVVNSSSLTRFGIGDFEISSLKFKTVFEEAKFFSQPRDETMASWRPVLRKRFFYNLFHPFKKNHLFQSATVDYTHQQKIRLSMQPAGLEALAKVISELLREGHPMALALKTFLNAAHTSLASVSSGAFPVSSAIPFIALGVETIKKICEKGKCDYAASENDITAKSWQKLNNFNPLDAENYIALVDAWNYLPLGICDTIFLNAHVSHLKQQLVLAAPNALYRELDFSSP
jgi:hypothetical protein